MASIGRNSSTKPLSFQHASLPYTARAHPASRLAARPRVAETRRRRMTLKGIP